MVDGPTLLLIVQFQAVAGGEPDRFREELARAHRGQHVGMEHAQPRLIRRRDPMATIEDGMEAVVAASGQDQRRKSVDSPLPHDRRELRDLAGRKPQARRDRRVVTDQLQGDLSGLGTRDRGKRVAHRRASFTSNRWLDWSVSSIPPLVTTAKRRVRVGERWSPVRGHAAGEGLIVGTGERTNRQRTRAGAGAHTLG